MNTQQIVTETIRLFGHGPTAWIAEEITRQFGQRNGRNWSPDDVSMIHKAFYEGFAQGHNHASTT